MSSVDPAALPRPRWQDLKWPGLWAPIVVFAAAFLAGMASLVVAWVSLGVSPGARPGAVFFGVVAEIGFMAALALFCLVTVVLANRLPFGAAVRAGLSLERRDILLATLLLGGILVLDIPVSAFLSRFGPVLDEEATLLLANPAMMISSFTLVPVAEELWGRGLVYGALQRWGPWPAILGATLISAVAHFRLLQSIGVLPAMFALSWLRYRTKRLAPSILLHAGNNFVALALSPISVGM